MPSMGVSPLAGVLDAVAGSAGAAPVGVPDLEQAHTYDCGPTALRSAFRYFGVTASVPQASRSEGIAPEAILDAATAAGLRAELREGMTSAELPAVLDGRTVAILSVQALRHPQRGWDHGHYIVADSAASGKANAVWFMDPADGRHHSLPFADLDPRWHDEDHGHRRHGVAVLLSRR